MANVRNAVILGGAAVVSCAALATQLLVAAGVDFPASTGVGQGWRYLEGRATAEAPQLSLDAFASGEFQDGMESYAADALPFHDQAMLLNAGLQQVGIAQAASFFGFEAYPTYFGSTRLYLPEQDAVTYLPFEHTEYHDQKLAEYAQGIADAAARHPEKRFVVYMVQGYSEPAVDPAYGLVSGAFLPQEAVEAFKEALADCPNVTVLTDSYDSLDAYYQEFYRSDHHWNILGAMRAYNTIAGELGLETVDVAKLSLHEVKEGYEFTGATSRWGRHMVADEALDADLDYSAVTYEKDGEVLDGNDHSAFYDYDPQGIAYSFYDAYYNSIPDGIISGPGQGKALLISNSYGGALQRQLATQFSQLEKASALWQNYTGRNLEGLLQDCDADTVVFVANPTDYMTAAATLPDFFSEEASD